MDERRILFSNKARTDFGGNAKNIQTTSSMHSSQSDNEEQEQKKTTQNTFVVSLWLFEQTLRRFRRCYSRWLVVFIFMANGYCSVCLAVTKLKYFISFSHNIFYCISAICIATNVILEFIKNVLINFCFFFLFMPTDRVLKMNFDFF